MTAAGGGPVRLPYGDAASQFFDLWAPQRRAEPAAIVFIHGGYWRDRYDLTLMDPLCAAVRDRGWWAVNLEYRRVGADGGGWPATFDDLGAGLDAIVRRPELQGCAVAVVGHSAGGHLALLAEASRLDAVVALAPVGDLGEASRRGLSDHAVHDLLGGPPEAFPERYAATDPMRLLPPALPVLVVHGDADVNVPIDLSDAYARAATAAGGEVTYHRLAGVDHFDVIDPASAAWQGVASWLSPIVTTPSPSTSETP